MGGIATVVVLLAVFLVVALAIASDDDDGEGSPTSADLAADTCDPNGVQQRMTELGSDAFVEVILELDSVSDKRLCLGNFHLVVPLHACTMHLLFLKSLQDLSDACDDAEGIEAALEEALGAGLRVDRTDLPPGVNGSTAVDGMEVFVYNPNTAPIAPTELGFLVTAAVDGSSVQGAPAVPIAPEQIEAVADRIIEEGAAPGSIADTIVQEVAVRTGRTLALASNPDGSLKGRRRKGLIAAEPSPSPSPSSSSSPSTGGGGSSPSPSPSPSAAPSPSSSPGPAFGALVRATMTEFEAASSACGTGIDSTVAELNRTAGEVLLIVGVALDASTTDETSPACEPTGNMGQNYGREYLSSLISLAVDIEEARTRAQQDSLLAQVGFADSLGNFQNPHASAYRALDVQGQGSGLKVASAAYKLPSEAAAITVHRILQEAAQQGPLDYYSEQDRNQFGQLRNLDVHTDFRSGMSSNMQPATDASTGTMIMHYTLVTIDDSPGSGTPTTAQEAESHGVIQMSDGSIVHSS